MSSNESDELQVFKSLAVDIEPLSLDQQTKTRLKRKVMARIQDTPASEGTLVHANQLDWIELNPFLSIKVLWQDVENNLQFSYWRLKPGAVIPWHSHQNQEDCVVLEGDIRIGDTVLLAGDFNHMEKGSSHGPITTVGGALLYLKHDIQS